MGAIKVAQGRKKRRESDIEARNMEGGWEGNFGFGARLPDYEAASDKYCPLAVARAGNTRKKKETVVKPMTRMEIMTSATMALSGTMTNVPMTNTMSAGPGDLISRNYSFSKTAPLPPIPLQPPAPPAASISFQSDVETADSLEIVKLVLTRATACTKLSALLQSAEGELAVLRAAGKEDKAKFPTKEFSSLCEDTRTLGLKIVEMVVVWAENQPDPATAVYQFRESDYLAEFLTSLDFLDENQRARQALNVGCLRYNPFLSPIPVRTNKMVPKDEFDEVEYEETYRWSTADDFHKCKVREVGAGTDILQIKDASVYLAKMVERGGEVEERELAALSAQKELRRLAEEEREAREGLTAPETTSPSPPHSPTKSENNSPKAIPFFVQSEFKYATYMPTRNVLGELDGLDDMELSTHVEKVGVAEVFDAKANAWKTNAEIPLASMRRGTFFGTLSREKAAEPRQQLMRIVETVSMLKAREKLARARFQLENVVKEGKGEEKEIEMLKGELALLREKVDKASKIHDDILSRGAVERARKFKVKWSYWYEESAELTVEIKKRAAALFLKKSDVPRCVRMIDKLTEEYGMERNKAAAEVKRREVVLERKKECMAKKMQRIARGMITRAKVYPILRARVAAATSIANKARQRRAVEKVEKVRVEFEEKRAAAVKLQQRGRLRAAKKKVAEVRVEKAEKEALAAKLQGLGRARIARKKVGKVRKDKEERGATVLLQGKIRGGFAVKEAERRRKKKAMLLIMSCSCRVWLSYRRVGRKMAEKEERENEERKMEAAEVRRLAEEELQRVEEAKRERVVEEEMARVEKVRLEAEMEVERRREELELARKEQERREIMQKEEDVAFTSEEKDGGEVGVLDAFLELEGAVASISLITEEESVGDGNDWELDMERSYALHSDAVSSRPRTASTAHYARLAGNGTEEEDTPRGTMHAVAAATPANVEHVLNSSKSLDGRKKESVKYLMHVGHKARLQQSLVKDARAAVLVQGKDKLAALRKRQGEDVAWLTHQGIRCEAYLWLRARGEVEYERGQGEVGKTRDEAQEWLENEANRWMN